MKLFNAKLNLISVTQIANGQWKISANIIDTTGTFFVSDASIGDNIICYGQDQNTGETNVCKYKITQKLAGGSYSKLVCSVTWAENNTNYADPQTGLNGLIGKCMQGNMTAITSTINNIDSQLIESARNIDLATASFTGTSNKRETILMTSDFITKKTYTLLNTVKDNSEVVILNGSIQTRGSTNDYVLNNNVLSFNTSVNFNTDDTLVVLYMV